MKFKVGDKVILKDNLEVGRCYRGVDLLSDMVEDLSKPDTITDTHCGISLENSGYSYTEEMLDLVVEPTCREYICKPEEAKRYNSGKIEFDDIPLLGIIEVSKAGAYGRGKYGKQNWRKSAETSQYLNCAMRHILKYMYGETYDSESKCHHLGHAAWNILALLEKIITKNDKDDRFKYDNDIDMDSIFKVENED